MEKHNGFIDATPSKRIFLSIIADYDINKAICELIDNALDLWIIAGRRKDVEISITLDISQQRICVNDNAGGLERSELSYIVGPGRTGNTNSDQTIGIFGVGTKRAVVALAQDITIKTRKDNKTYSISFDDQWIKKEDEWQLPVYEIEDIPCGSTYIELLKLRQSLNEEKINILKLHLGAVYSEFLGNQNVIIQVNKEEIIPITFDNWAYPPDFEPRKYTATIKTKTDEVVSLSAIAGLTLESSPAGGEYGVYFYCNNRLIAQALKTLDVGFATGLAGKPHADISLVRVLIFLEGPARLMPWNSSKSNVNSSHEVFISIQKWLINVVQDYSSLARRTSKFEGGWKENVFKYSHGSMEIVSLSDIPNVNTSYLPPLPMIRQRYTDKVEKDNESIAKSKPWTKGLYESMIVVDWILKQSFTQKNRIALILLDSTLEISFKEYLINESGETYNEHRFNELWGGDEKVDTS